MRWGSLLLIVFTGCSSMTVLRGRRWVPPTAPLAGRTVELELTDARTAPFLEPRVREALGRTGVKVAPCPPAGAGACSRLRVSASQRALPGRGQRVSGARQDLLVVHVDLFLFGPAGREWSSTLLGQASGSLEHRAVLEGGALIDAVELLEDAVSGAFQEVTLPVEAGLLLYEANSLAATGQLDLAEVHLAELVTERPRFAAGHFNRGAVAELRGDDGLALESYAKAVGLKRRRTYVDALARLRQRNPRAEQGAAAFATLQVEVVDASGAPVAATVTAAERRAATDAQGRLRLAGLQPGLMPVRAEAPGLEPAEEVASLVAARSAALRLVLKPRAAGTTATLTGALRDAASGTPLPHGAVSLAQLKRRVAVEPTGSFSLEVPPGPLTVTLSAGGYLSQQKSVTLKPGDRVILNVDLAPRAAP